MTNTNKDTPSAFPWVEPADALRGEAGMSLRDYFAGQALAGMAVSDGRGYGMDDERGPRRHASQRAKSAYLHADAMLAQREKSNG